jgi:predicted ribonuclease YlaK
MDTLVLLTTSMLLSGNFDSWDFLKQDEKYCIEPQTIKELKDIKDRNSNIINQKKAAMALSFIYHNIDSIDFRSHTSKINKDLRVYAADIGSYLELIQIYKNVVLYEPKERDVIPTFSRAKAEIIESSKYNSDNPLNLKVNQYFILNYEEGKDFLYKVNEDLTYAPIPYQILENDYFGKIKPKKNDARQLAAVDSLSNNQLTMLTGKAGTGKSYLALGALFSKLQKHEIDRIYMFCNPVATRDSARLGFYAGTKDEKLLDSQVGNFLDGKIGDRVEVERLMREGKLQLLPMSDIRGFDSNGKKAGIYITEAQNSTIDLMQLALERVGEDCVCIIDGDYKKQVDLDVYSDINNGMRRVSQIYLGQNFYGEVHLKNVYRSRIAALAAQMTTE